MADLIIVVIGVLIALALDSWRQTVALDRTEKGYLESLVRDLEGDLADLERAERAATTNEQSARMVLDVLDGRADGISTDSLAWAIETAGFLRFPAYFPYTFDDLVSTGNLAIIRNPELRRAVAAYYHSIRFEQQYWDRYRGIQTVYTQLVQGTLGPDIRAQITVAETIETSPEDRSRILSELRARPGLAAALEGVVWVQARQRRWHAINRGGAERLREMIVDEIEGKRLR